MHPSRSSRRPPDRSSHSASSIRGPVAHPSLWSKPRRAAPRSCRSIAMLMPSELLCPLKPIRPQPTSMSHNWTHATTPKIAAIEQTSKRGTMPTRSVKRTRASVGVSRDGVIHCKMILNFGYAGASVVQVASRRAMPLADKELVNVLPRPTAVPPVSSHYGDQERHPRLAHEATDDRTQA